MSDTSDGLERRTKRRVNLRALFAVFILFNVLITVGVLSSLDKAAAQMNGMLAIGNLAFVPLFYKAVTQ